MGNLYYSLVELIKASGHGARDGVTEAEFSALAQHLKILRAAPQPHLAKGRQRVFAEAARLEKHDRNERQGLRAMQLRFGFAWGALVLVLGTALFAVGMQARNTPESGAPALGFFKTPAVAVTSADAAGETKTIISASTPRSNPSPLTTGVVLTAVPGRLPEAAAAAEPTASPLLMLTRLAETPSKQ